MKRLASLVVLSTAALLISPSLYAQRGMSGRGGGGGGSFHGGGGFRSGPSGGGLRSAGPSGGFRSAGPGGFRSAGPGGFRSAGPGGFHSAPGGFRSGPGFRTFGPGQRTFAPSNRPFASRGFVSNRREFGGDNRRFGFRRFHRFHDRGFFFDDCFGCRSPFFFGGGLFLGSPFFPFYPGGYYGGDYYGDYGYGPPAQQQPVVVNADNGNTAALAADVQRLTDEVEDLRSEESRRDYEDRP